jgi:hypothetical protein
MGDFGMEMEVEGEGLMCLLGWSWPCLRLLREVESAVIFLLRHHSLVFPSVFHQQNKISPVSFFSAPVLPSLVLSSFQVTPESLSDFDCSNDTKSRLVRVHSK